MKTQNAEKISSPFLTRAVTSPSRHVRIHRQTQRQRLITGRVMQALLHQHQIHIQQRYHEMELPAIAQENKTRVI